MSKDDTISNIEYVTTELQKMHPEKGDIYILNVNTDDPDVLYSDEIMDSVEKLSETLEEFTGMRIPILVFGNELDISLMTKSDLVELIDTLDDDDIEDNADSEHLTDQFN